MCWEDFVSAFTKIQMCHFFDEGSTKLHAQSRWVKGRTSGGWPKTGPRTWLNNPQVWIRAKGGRDAKVYLNVSQPDIRLHGKRFDEDHSFETAGT
jgi:hypothetical protein